MGTASSMTQTRKFVESMRTDLRGAGTIQSSMMLEKRSASLTETAHQEKQSHARRYEKSATRSGDL